MTDFEISALRVELERLRTENARLHRSAGRQAAFVAKVERAYADGLLFLSLRVGGITPSRKYCAETLGMGRRRWQWAIAMLKLARLYRGDPANPMAAAQLERAKADALANPNVLRVRLTRHGRDIWSAQNRVRSTA